MRRQSVGDWAGPLGHISTYHEADPRAAACDEGSSAWPAAALSLVVRRASADSLQKAARTWV